MSELCNVYGKLNQLDRLMGWFLAAVKTSPCPGVRVHVSAQVFTELSHCTCYEIFGVLYPLAGTWHRIFAQIIKEELPYQACMCPHTMIDTKIRC
jgi:hypothetical protein